MRSPVRIAEARQGDTQQAVAALVEALSPHDPTLVIAFVGEPHDPREVAAGLARALPGVGTVGCSTGGELGPSGCTTGGLMAVGFVSPARASFAWFDALGDVALAGDAHEVVAGVTRKLGLEVDDLDPARHTFITLVDGMSSSGELFIVGVSDAAPGIPLVGGSAGSRAQQLDTTWTFADGKAATGSGVLILLEAGVPFQTFATHGYEAGDERLVVTKARPDQHLLDELNGRPAVEEFARVSGFDPEALRCGEVLPLEHGVHLGFHAGDEFYLRGLIEIRGDSVLLGGAVEEGMVLRTAWLRRDVTAITRSAIGQVIDAIGEPSALLLFECLGRRTAPGPAGPLDPLRDMVGDVPVVGFHTFGEQYGALQVNLTLTGLALGVVDG